MELSDIYLHPYTILNKKVPSYFFIWFLIHIILFFLISTLSATYLIERRIEYVGYYQNDVIKMLVDENYFLLSKDKVKIQKEEYSYQVKKIEPIAYTEGKASLWEVSILLELPENWRIENNQITLSFLKDKKTLLERVMNKIKKGMKF